MLSSIGGQGGRWARSTMRRYAPGLGLGLLVLGAVACGANGAEPGLPELKDPFRTWTHMAEGFTYEVEGYAVGHHRENPSPFTVRLANTTHESWEGSFCVLLLNQEGVAKELLQTSFAVGPSLLPWSEEWQVNGDWVEGVPERPYGLAVVFPERSAQYVTIWVGEPGHQSVPGWPQVTTCER